MGSTPYDGHVVAIGRDANPTGILPLVQSVQPTSDIAHGSEYLNPPLADRAFSAGFIFSPGGAIPVGSTGICFLARPLPGLANVPDPSDKTAAWFWFQAQPPAAQGLVGMNVALVPTATVTVGAVLVFPYSVDMAATPATLQCFSNWGPTGQASLNTIARVRENISTQDSWHGPYFKPANLIVIFQPIADGESAQVNVRWMELPKVR